MNLTGFIIFDSKYNNFYIILYLQGNAILRQNPEVRSLKDPNLSPLAILRIEG